jgi:diadenosine tetraphosphate (Ap4A) HIT family hydrolase
MEIFETEFWEVKLLENQYYLGRSIILLKRDCEKLSSLTEEEFKDLFGIIKKLENSLKNTFGATDSQKEGKEKPQVHLHLWPRYKERVEFAGEVFKDEVFAHHYDKAKEKIVSDEVLEKIAEALL